MASSLRCINRGGAASLLRLNARPKLEAAMSVDAQLQQALEAWRARPGEIFTLVDDAGLCYRARLHKADDGALQLFPFEQVADPEPRSRLVLFQALPEKERFELILQKGVELGVAAVVPYVSRYSISLAERDAQQRKSHRWPDVVLRAARQCRRRMVPELYPVVDWSTMLQEAEAVERRFLLHPGPNAASLNDLLQGELPASLALIVGPEGGFAAPEVEEALAAGCELAGLGPRLLRTETAAICALSLTAAAGDSRSRKL